MERRVMFNRVFGLILMVLASALFALSLSMGLSINTITGALLLLISVFYLVQPALVYTNDELFVKNLIGMTLKKYHFLNDQVSIENGKIYSAGKKIAVVVALLNRRDYSDLLEHILTKKLEKQDV